MELIKWCTHLNTKNEFNAMTDNYNLCKGKTIVFSLIYFFVENNFILMFG